MRNIRRGLSILLAVLMMASVCFPERVSAAGSCAHEAGEEFKTESTGDDITDVDTYAKCRKCGDWFLYCTNDPAKLSAISNTELHNWVQGDVGYPTCTEDGFFEVKCTNCGTVLRQTTQAALGHSWSEWTTTGEVLGDGRRTESRECSECGERETRIAGEAYGQLDIFIFQQLLTDGGEYTGAVDGSFNAALKKAIEAFESANGRVVTGAISSDILSLLAGRFAEALDSESLLEEVYMIYDCGLRVEGIISYLYEENGDGTHEVMGTLTGLRFTKGSESRNISIPESKWMGIQSYEEACSVKNNELACAKCGYHPNALTFALSGTMDYLQEEGAANWALVNLDDGFDPWGLPELDVYMAGSLLCWTALYDAGVKYYRIGAIELGGLWIELETEEEEAETQNQTVVPNGLKEITPQEAESMLEDLDSEPPVDLFLAYAGSSDGFEEYMSMEFLGLYRAESAFGESEDSDGDMALNPVYAFDMGELMSDGRDYLFTVTAVYEDGTYWEDVSETAGICRKEYMKAAEITDLWVEEEDGGLHIQWEVDYPMSETAGGYWITYELGDGDEIEGPSVSYSEEELVERRTFCDYVLTKEELEKLKGKVFRVIVCPYGKYNTSDEAFSPYMTLEKIICKVLANVNLREGPGKDYERVGGVQAGTYVVPLGEENDYTRIYYNGETGWVMSSALSYATPQIHTITLVVETDDRVVIKEQSTNFAGTLTPKDASGQDFTREDRDLLGWSIYGVLPEEGEGSYELESLELALRNFITDQDREKHPLLKLKNQTFTKDMTLVAFWKKREHYNNIRFYDLDGNELPDMQMVYLSDKPLKGVPEELKNKMNRMTTPVTWHLGSPESLVIVGNGTELEWNWEGYDLYAGPAVGEAWIRLRMDCKLLDGPRDSNKALDELKAGEEVCVLEAPGNTDFAYISKQLSLDLAFNSSRTHVRTRDGKEGYVLSYYLSYEEVPSTVYFDAGEGYCAVKALKTGRDMEHPAFFGTLLGSTLPKASRDGYVFIGWKYEDGTPYRQEDFFWNNAILYADYLEMDAATQKTVLFHSFSGFHYYEGDESYLSPGDDFQSPLLTVVGETDDRYQVYTALGLGYVEKERVTDNYTLCKLRGASSLEIRWGVKLKSSHVFTQSEMRRINSAGIYKFEEKKGYAHVVYYNPVNGNWSCGWIDNDALHGRPEISFDACGGVMTGQAKLEYKGEGVRVTSLPEVNLRQRKFIGWFTDPSQGKLVTRDLVFEENTTLYAHYESTSYRVVTGGNRTLYHGLYQSDPSFDVELELGTVAMVLDSACGGKFTKIYASGRSGWIRSDELAAGEAAYMYGRIRGEDMEARKSASRKSKDVGNTANDTLYVIMGREGDYYKVAGEPWGRFYAYIYKGHLWTGTTHRFTPKEK